VLLCTSGSVIAQQAVQPSQPADSGTEMGNLGLVPFMAQETLLLRPEDKAAIRKLEDKHLKELRDFEDKYATDLLAMRRKQADEREALRKTFKR
jgi:hypothetical protein